MDNIVINEGSIIGIVSELPPREGREPVKIMTTVIDIKSLANKASFAIRKVRDDEGYQRAASPKRIANLKANLDGNNVDLPTSILSNLRKYRDDALMILGPNGKGPQFAILDLNNVDAYIVDGQHRVKSLIDLYKENPGKWENFVLPAVFTLGMAEELEMKMFWQVNSNAKSVDTNLAYELLQQISAFDSVLEAQMEEKGTIWLVKAQSLVKTIEAGSKMWPGLVRFPNELKGETTVTSSGFVNSLKAPFSTPWFSRYDEDSQLRILDAYWEGIRDCVPAAFISPQEYVIQKSLGVYVMHQILIDVMYIALDRKLDYTSPRTYKDILSEPLEKLSGENPDGEMVYHEDFWKSGKEGAAAGYSSGAGKRILVNRLMKSLPRIQVS